MTALAHAPLGRSGIGVSRASPMGLDHLDLAYPEKPPEGISVDEVVAQAGALIEAGELRAWGVLNAHADASGRIASRRGHPAIGVTSARDAR